jgi:hypothetical protein
MLNENSWGMIAKKCTICGNGEELENTSGISAPSLERCRVLYYAIGAMLRLIYEGKTQGLDGDLRKLSTPNQMDAPDQNTRRDWPSPNFSSLRVSPLLRLTARPRNDLIFAIGIGSGILLR